MPTSARHPAQESPGPHHIPHVRLVDEIANHQLDRDAVRERRQLALDISDGEGPIAATAAATTLRFAARPSRDPRFHSGPVQRVRSSAPSGHLDELRSAPVDTVIRQDGVPAIIRGDDA
jgi:hypothetical protein